MKHKSLDVYRRWAYLFFGFTLLAFLGGLIPAMFMGNIVLTGISATVVLVAALLSLLTGRIGFMDGEPLMPKNEPTDANPAGEKIQHTPLDPDEVAFDETNWLYSRGGDVHSKRPPHHHR